MNRPSSGSPTWTTRLLGVVGELLITAGVVVLLFAGWQLWWTDVLANRQAQQVTQQLRNDWQQGVAPAILPGRAFAIVYIPRLGGQWSRPLVEGVSSKDLREGVGHYPDSALPGEVGNVAIAGHRTTYGRPFHDVETVVNGDFVVVETAQSWFTYQVRSHEVVQPTAAQVVAPVPDQPGVAPTEAWLTLTTCHPKYSAEQRWVVHAILMDQRPHAKGPPPELR